MFAKRHEDFFIVHDTIWRLGCLLLLIDELRKLLPQRTNASVNATTPELRR
jgi:hypothetical protein